MKHLKWGLLSFTSINLLLAACSNDEPKEYFIKAENETIEHIHGAGYWSKEGTPVIATHGGHLNIGMGPGTKHHVTITITWGSRQ